MDTYLSELLCEYVYSVMDGMGPDSREMINEEGSISRLSDLEFANICAFTVAPLTCFCPFLIRQTNSIQCTSVFC